MILYVTFIVLLVLKLLGYFPYSWWFVFLPIFIGVLLLIIMAGAIAAAQAKMRPSWA